MKLTSLVALCLSGAVIFSACGGGGDDGNDSTGNGSTPAATSGAGATSPTEAASSRSDVPADACALLTLAEVQQVAPLAEAGKPTREEGPIETVGCLWEWTDPGATLGGAGSLELKISTLPPGVSEDTFKASQRVRAADAGENGREVEGIGDYATLTSLIGASAELSALVNGLNLNIELGGFVDGGVARDKQDALIPLAKLVEERL